MCLIIFAPDIRHVKIRRAILERGFNRNSDGAGIAYVKDGQLTVSKAHFDIDSFIRDYHRIKSSTHRGPLLIHFRYKTCGPANDINTQPIVIHGGRLVMAHNGIFSGLSEAESDVSDSVRLARLIRRNGWEFPFTNAQIEMLEALCDGASKLVFIDPKGKHLIINEKLGAWRAGAWYSDKGRVFTPYKSFYKRDDESFAHGYTNPYDRDEEDHSRGYTNDYDAEIDESIDNDPEGRMFAAAMMTELDRQAQTRIKLGITPKQTGLLKRPKIPEGTPYHKMTKEQKTAFEAWREQELRAAAREKRSVEPTHPTYGHPWLKRHSVVHVGGDFGAINRFNDMGD